MTVNYVRWLRSYVGHQRLLQIAASAFIRDEAGRVLLGRRSDVMLWAPPSGVIQLGETPAKTLVREVDEETGLHVRVERLIGLYSGPDFEWTYPNGDQAQIVTAFFACAVEGGVLRPDHHEFVDLGYFAPGAFPSLMPRCVRMLDDALADKQGVFDEVMKRIAYASPLNPAGSGISDYSEELLPYLARYAEITPYVADGLRPSNAELLRHMDVRPLSRLERDQRRQPYDAIIYHMGNSVENHAAIWAALQRTPGVVVLHEFVLHHFMLGYAAVTRRNVELYRAEAVQRYGPEGTRVAELMLHGRLTEAAFDMPFCESVLDAAEGVLAHSRYVLDRVAALRPGLPAALAPMGVPLPPAIPRDQARARLGLPQGALILASFGHINPYKRVEAALRAVKALRAGWPDVRYMLVGSISPSYDVRAAITRAGREDSVTVTGYVDRAAFEDYVAAADICLNLRHPTAGETSASLLRLLGAGKPTLVTASGSFAELPPGIAAQVDLDASEGDLILEYCRLLAARPDLAAAMGAQARAYVAREHTLDGAAAGYMRFLAARYSWGDTPALRAGPLWATENREPRTENQEPRTGEPRTGEPRTENQEPRTGAPPSGYPTKNKEQGTTADNGQQTTDYSQFSEALAGLGATEDDRPLIEDVARAMAELGMTNQE